MIKDNHIKVAGSITKAVELSKSNVGHMVSIEVETETKEQVLEAIEAGAHVIMLDNRSPEEIRKLIEIIPDDIVVEIWRYQSKKYCRLQGLWCRCYFCRLDNTFSKSIRH